MRVLAGTMLTPVCVVECIEIDIRISNYNRTASLYNRNVKRFPKRVQPDKKMFYCDGKYNVEKINFKHFHCCDLLIQLHESAKHILAYVRRYTFNKCAYKAIIRTGDFSHSCAYDKDVCCKILTLTQPRRVRQKHIVYNVIKMLWTPQTIFVYIHSKR